MFDSILKRFVQLTAANGGWIGGTRITGVFGIGLMSFILAASSSSGLASLLRTQTVELKPGWNAVFLEVQPTNGAPGEVFRGLPVQAVACFVAGSMQEQYLRIPGDAPWKEEGWLIWYESSLPEAFLSNLFQVHSHRAYLVKASSSFTWQVTGTAGLRPIQWYPNTCTLTGLPVDPEHPPTFAEFFAGSSAHRQLRIYRLEATGWKLVADPTSARPRSGEAFWIQTEGASSYQGTFRLTTAASGEIDFESLATQKAIEVVNDDTSEGQVQFESMDDSRALPLSSVQVDLSRRTSNSRPLPRVLQLPILAPGDSVKLQLALDRAALFTSSATALLKVSDGRGTQQWLPIKAQQPSVHR